MYSGLRPRLARRHGAPCPGRSDPLRAALEAARSRIGEVQGARPSRRTRAQQLYYLLDRAEDSFIAMVAAADLLESNAPRWLGRNAGAHLCHALHRYASVCNAIAGTSDADARQADRLRERLERYGADLRELRGPALAHAPSWPASFRCWTGCNSPPSPSGRPCSTPPSCRPARHPARPPRRQAWNTLRQNLRLESDALRHALRVGIGATLAVALSRSFAVNHGYWMSLTLVFILQPYFAATWQWNACWARRGRDRRLFAGPAAEHAAFRRAGRAADRARHVRRAHGELRPVHVLPDLAVRAGQPYPAAGPARTGTGRAASTACWAPCWRC